MPAANSVERDYKKKLTEIPSLLDFSGKGDAQVVTDAVMHAPFQWLRSATAGFVVGDVGKRVVVVGAGAAGADLDTTISGFVSSTEVLLTAAASVNVSAARAEWGTDNTTPFTSAAASGISLLTLPAGRYLFSGQAALLDKLGLTLRGAGDGTVLVPTPALNNNFIDLSGSIDLELAHFKVDGRYLRDVSLSLIYGDGTAENATYGNIRVRHLTIDNVPWLCCAVGANTGMTAQDIRYEYLRFYNCSHGSFGANTIDCGSSGTKKRFRIHKCQFVYVTQPSSNPGNAIFAGHGINEDFHISENEIYDCPTTGINVHNRPFVSEATSLKNFTVADNIIHRPRWNGISVFGGEQVNVQGNTVLNPGQALSGTPETRCGILISSQITGASTEQPALNLLVEGNVLIDDQIATMEHGILESNGNMASAALRATGAIMGNIISGYSVAEVGGLDSLTKLAMLRHDPTNRNWRVGRASVDKARWSVEGDVRAERSDVPDLFVQLGAESAQSLAGFLLTLGAIRFDGADYKGPADGTSNGAAWIGIDYGTGAMKFYTKATTGGTPQTIATADLPTLVRVWLKSDGSIGFGVEPTAYPFDVANDAAFRASVYMIPLTANRPLKLDGSKQVVAAFIDLMSEVGTSVLPVANGGTGLTTLAAVAAALKSLLPPWAIADVTGLQAALDGKSVAGHTHSFSSPDSGGDTLPSTDPDV